MSGEPEAPAPASGWRVASPVLEAGPLAHEDFIAGVASGRFGPDAFAWRDGMRAWARIGDLPECAPILRRRGLHGMTRARLVRLGMLSVISGSLVAILSVLAALGGRSSVVLAAIAGALAAPGVMMIWIALKRPD